jgi:hypothetical protein
MSRRVTFLILPLLVLFAAGAARAECYADYKARRDAPLRLHYGVIRISDAACGSRDAAQSEIAPRIAKDGWTLLTVLSTFDESGLASRKDNAGDYFLRY